MPNYILWLGKMRVAWEKKDYDVLSSMLSDELAYHESPFLPPLTIKKQVVAIWKKDLDTQSDIHFDFDILHEDEHACFAHWTASFIRSNVRVNLNGIFHFKLTAENLCTYFKMWWVTK